MTETNEEKRNRAQLRLAQPDAASLSDRAIAAELGVSQPFISALRKTMGQRAPSDNGVASDNGCDFGDHAAPDVGGPDMTSPGVDQSVQEPPAGDNGGELGSNAAQDVDGRDITLQDVNQGLILRS